MKKTAKFRIARSCLYSVMLAFILSGCSSTEPVIQIPGVKPHDFKVVEQNMLYDYTQGAKQTQDLIRLLQSPKASTFFNIVQLGDSHTAGDMMSGTTRQVLQAAYGVGSVGFIEPSNVDGQNNSQVTYQKSSISLINARKTKDYDYFFGGYIASFIEGGEVAYRSNNITPNTNGYVVARCTNQPNCSLVVATEQDIQEVEFTTRWELKPITLSREFSLISQNTALEVAGLFQVNQKKGLSYTAIGSNGATLNYLDTWGYNWPNYLNVLQPNLVILAYGTNESFGNVNVASYKAKYTKLIQQIRSANPNAAIMVVSNPDSLNKIYPAVKNTTCAGQQHPGVMQIHKALQEVAQANHTLYWDWLGAMGGQCSMVDVVATGAARPDGVHFALNSYKLFGKKLAQDLMNVKAWNK